MNTPQMASVKWMLFKNSTRGVIPSHGVFQGSGNSTVDPTTGEVLITAGPCADGPFFINGPCAVPDGGYGMCGMPANCTMFVRFEGSTGGLVPWDTKVGPEPSGVVAKTTGEPAFLYAGYTSDDGTLISVISLPTAASAKTKAQVIFAITDPDCVSGTALATVVAVTCDATEPAIGDTITVHDRFGWFSSENDVTLPGREGVCHKFNIPDGYDDCTYIITLLAGTPLTC